MAGMYTQEDFLRELERSGLGGSFSDADLKLAMINPDAGMSLISQKQAWGAATTDEGRAAANAAAENIRRQYGGYTGGADGSGYTLEPVSPGSFSYGSAPTYQDRYGGTVDRLFNQQMSYGSFNDSTVKPVYQNQYAGQIGNLMDKQMNYGSFTDTTVKPTYENQYAGQMGGLLDKQLGYGEFKDETVRPEYASRYDSQIQDALGKVTNPEKFTYDAESDPLYAQYAKTYAREGRRASEDALGQAAAMTGGVPSSYAITAAQQAGNYYAAQMSDKLPELYDRAYNQYLNEYQMQQAALQELMNAEAQDYAKYQDSMSQYNTDRNFAFEQYLSNYNRILQDMASLQAMEQNDYAKYLNDLQQYNTDRNFAYGQYLDEYDRLAQQMAAAQSLEQNDYAKYLNSLSQYNTDRNFAYGSLLDDINFQTQRRQEAQEQSRYDREWQYQLEQDALDRETENARYENEYKMALAELAAGMGDISHMRDLGITPSSSAVQGAANTSADTAKYINFMLGYWDEPGVREYIRAVTGLDPERYAEYLRFSEGKIITYKPEEKPSLTGAPVSVPTYNGIGSVKDFISQMRS